MMWMMWRTGRRHKSTPPWRGLTFGSSMACSCIVRANCWAPRGYIYSRHFVGLRSAFWCKRSVYLSMHRPSFDALMPKFSFDMVQAPLNLIDMRLVTSGWLQCLKERAIEVHTRSTFLQGLLLLPRQDIPAQFDRWSGLWDRWHQWLEQHGESAARACLALPLSFPEIDRVVVGTDSATQLRQLLASAATRPSAKLLDLTCDDADLINPARWQPNV